MRAALRMAEAAGVEPPPRKGSPALREVSPGAWWRVHAFDTAMQQYAPERFNASGLGNARFSPLQGPGGTIPTLYAAGTLDSALMETVLHDVPTLSQGHIHDVDRDLRSNLHASSIDVTAPLRLVDLTKIGLQRMGLRVTDLFETEAADYARTRRSGCTPPIALLKGCIGCQRGSRSVQRSCCSVIGCRDTQFGKARHWPGP
jgi:RES domain